MLHLRAEGLEEHVTVLVLFRPDSGAAVIMQAEPTEFPQGGPIWPSLRCKTVHPAEAPGMLVLVPEEEIQSHESVIAVWVHQHEIAAVLTLQRTPVAIGFAAQHPVAPAAD